MGPLRSPPHTHKRVLEYGVRAPVFCGNLREKIVFHENLQEACFVLTEISQSLRKPPEVYGGECNLGLGILYSSSLFTQPSPIWPRDLARQLRRMVRRVDGAEPGRGRLLI